MTCKICPANSNCSTPAIQLEALPVQPGFWRSHTKSTQLRRCYIKGVCLGGTNFSESCDEGHTGA